MRLAGPLRIVALIIIMGLTWILVTILLGGPGSGLPRIQQFFTSPENSVTAGKPPVPSLFPPVPAFYSACVIPLPTASQPPRISVLHLDLSQLPIIAFWAVNLVNELPTIRR